VPRIKELLSLSKNIKTPIMTILLENKYKENKELANKIASHIKYTTIRDIRKRMDIYYDPDPLRGDGFMKKDNVYNIFYSHAQNRASCQKDVNSLPWLLRIELDKEKMMEKDITLLDIKAKFCNNWERRYSDPKGMRKEEKYLLDKITQCSILSNTDSDKNAVLHIRYNMTSFDFSIMIEFLETFVENFKLKGLESIKKISSIVQERYISFENENQEMKNMQQHVIYTAGVNMIDIRYINGIDMNAVMCNDIATIYEIFGIEAARNALLKEFKATFGGAGSFVNHQHLGILVDIMTNNGHMTSIDRHGLNRLETDPLARASFEKTVDQLVAAAVFGEVDHMKSVSSRIMAGLVIKGGTGLCNMLLDTELLENSEYTEDIEQKFNKTFREVSESTVMNDIINKETEGIFIPM